MSHSVLVLEESDLIQDIIASALDESNLAVYRESQPGQFFETAKQLQPDLIFISNSDHKQEYAVCRQLKSDTDLGSVPLVLLVESRDKLDSAALTELKIDGHLRKPFEAASLQEQLRKFLPPAFPLPASEAYEMAQSTEEIESAASKEFSVLDDEVLDLISEQAEEPTVAESNVPEVDFSDEFNGPQDFENEEEKATMLDAFVETDGPLMDDALSMSEVDQEIETIDTSEFEELELENFEELETELEEDQEITFEEEENLEEEGLALDDEEAEMLEVIEVEEEESLDFELEEELGMEIDLSEEEGFESPLSALKESGLEDEMVQSQLGHDSEILDETLDLADESFEIEVEELGFELEDDDDSDPLELEGVDPATIGFEELDEDFEMDSIKITLIEDEDSLGFEEEPPPQKLREGLVDIGLDLNDFEVEIGIRDYDDTDHQSLNEGLVDIGLDLNDFDPEFTDLLSENQGKKEVERDDLESSDSLAEMDTFVLGISAEEKNVELKHQENGIVLLDIEAITKDDIFEENLELGSMELEEGLTLDEDLDTSEMEEKALSELNDLDQEMSDLEMKGYDLHLEKLDESPALVDATTEDEIREEFTMASDFIEEPELIMEDSTEGEEMVESILDAPVSEMAFEAEVELDDSDFSAPEGEQLVFQAATSDDNSSEGSSSEQLGKLLENIITISVQKSIETAMPDLVNQIVKKLKEET